MKEEIIINNEDIIKETMKKTEIQITDLNNNMNLNSNINMAINKQPDTYYNCLIKRITNLKYGLNGLYYLFIDKSILMQVFFACLLITGGIIINFSIIQWILQLIIIAINIGGECCNTIIELIANFVEPNFNKEIGLIKDISAGMVILIMLITIPANVLIYFI